MAQAEETIEDDSEHEEAVELERLLEGSQEDGEEEAESGEPTPKKAGGSGFGKKTWILVGGGVILILLLAGGAYFFLFSPQNPESEIQSGEQAGESVPATPPVETVKSQFNKVHIFTLKPFFLPLKVNEKETGKYISVIPNLILSNSTLSEEIESSLPAIRRNIYNVLSRKSPRDYFSGKGKIEEKIKKEIIVTVNPVLLAGTGSITDVVFTQFVVK